MLELQQGVVGASRSLRKLSRDKDDLVGLIAYGLFKYEQSEWAEHTRPSREDVEKHPETLQDTRIESLRSNAAEKLSNFVSSLEEQWREELYNDIKRDVVGELSAQFESKIKEQLSSVLAQLKVSSSLGRAILANLLAWILSLALTIIVIAAFFAPSVSEILKRLASS